jgi:hypothetical protein
MGVKNGWQAGKKTAKDSTVVCIQKANSVSLVTASSTDNKSCKKRPSEAFPGLFLSGTFNDGVTEA